MPDGFQGIKNIQIHAFHDLRLPHRRRRLRGFRARRAPRLQHGATCLVIDRRDHIGGNANDHYDRAGILIHTYGPHYFRTNSDRIVDYLSQFTEWHPVEYKILSWTDGRYWQFPINLNTFEQLLGRASTSEEMQTTLEQWRIPIADPKNSEEVILSQVGERLYEMFFKNYTRKQWRREPRDLDASVCGRIPIRTNRDDRYLSEKFQALPKDGYTAMFKKMLDHPKIEVRLNTDYREARHEVHFKRLIYTGPIDEYFDYRFGPLPYRSLRFEPETYRQEFFQPAMQINYPNDHEFTRIVEIKHATGQISDVTTVVREYPQDFISPAASPTIPYRPPTRKPSTNNTPNCPSASGRPLRRPPRRLQILQQEGCGVRGAGVGSLG